MINSKKLYLGGYSVAFTAIFLGVWIYSFEQYGWLGLALGWAPALLLAAVVSFLWPVLALGLVSVIFVVAFRAING